MDIIFLQIYFFLVLRRFFFFLVVDLRFLVVRLFVFVFVFVAVDLRRLRPPVTFPPDVKAIFQYWYVYNYINISNEKKYITKTNRSILLF